MCLPVSRCLYTSVWQIFQSQPKVNSPAPKPIPTQYPASQCYHHLLSHKADTWAIWNASPPSSFIPKFCWIKLSNRFQLLSFFIYTFIVLVHTRDSPLVTSMVSCLVRVFFLQSHPPSPTTHTLIPWVRGIYLKLISDHITPLNKILQCLPSRTWPLLPSGCVLHLLSLLPMPKWLSIPWHFCILFHFWAFSCSFFYPECRFLSLNMFTPVSFTWSKDASSQEAYPPSSRMT